MNGLRIALAAFLFFTASAVSTFGQETMAAARQLYGAAAYDEALAALDRLKASGAPASSDGHSIDTYRALCQLALGRSADAERTIETLVRSDPSYRPNDAEASPRVLSVFADVRRKTVPARAQERYLTGKAAFDRKDYTAALEDFNAVLQWIDAPDLASAVGQPPLSDLRTLAVGFRDLTKVAMAPPPPPPAPAAPAPAVTTAPATVSGSAPAAAPAKSAASAATPTSGPAAGNVPVPSGLKPVYYKAEDSDVTPPVAISQRLPSWPAAMPIPLGGASRGVLEVLISENGSVESARPLRTTVAFFDQRLVEEAMKWKFKPATKDGVPVRYCRLVQVMIAK
jgi:hypothetical protein